MLNFNRIMTYDKRIEEILKDIGFSHADSSVQSGIREQMHKEIKAAYSMDPLNSIM